MSSTETQGTADAIDAAEAADAADAASAASTAETAETADVAEAADVASAAERAERAEMADVAEAADVASTAETADAADAAEAAETPDAAGGSAPARRGRAGIILVAVGVLLVLVGGLLFYRAHALRDTDAAHNSALTDVAATSRVNGDVSSALAKVFSYTPDGTDATVRAARASLSGRAARQYAQLFARVRADVRDQKVTLSTQTVRVGTVSLRGNTAHLLVFLDQTARRGSKKPTTSAAQLSVTAELRGDVWRIVDLKAR